MSKRLKAMGPKKYKNGFEVTLHPECLDEPLHWRKPCRIFVCSMSDLFHPEVPFEFIDKVYYRIYRGLRHTFQVLTKRPGRMLEYLEDETAVQLRLLKLFPNWTPESRLTGRFPLPNLWLGVSVENQKAADERIPKLLQIPAAVRWVSLEPLLGKIVLSMVDELDWVVIGAESGPNRRPCKLEWVRSIVAQCKAAGVPVFVKQLDIDGKVVKKIEQFPPDLKVREYPK